MNGYKAVKVAELRAKLGSIPAKLILSILILFAISWDTDLEATALSLLNDPFTSVKNLVIFYGLLSYVYFFIRIFNNYVVGCLVAAAGIFALYSIRDKMEPEQFRTLVIIMLVGGPVLDVIRLLRYSSLKREVIEESENMRDKIDDIYDNVRGFDEGYDRGFQDGYNRGSYEEYDEIRERRRGRIGRKKRRRRDERYDDRIEDSYYEDSNYEDEYDEYDRGDGYDEEYDDSYEEYDDSPGSGGERGSRDRAGGGDGNYGFFDGCKSPEAVKRRYRELCKVYHPDSGNGSEALFEAVNEEYRRIMDE